MGTRVRFRQSGGFAGLVRGCEFDLTDLPAGEQQQINRLLEAGDQQPLLPPTAAVRDSMHYELWIATPDGTKEFSFAGSQVTPALHPLLQFLGARAKPVEP